MGTRREQTDTRPELEKGLDARLLRGKVAESSICVAMENFTP